VSDKYVKKHLEMKYFVLKPGGSNLYAHASRLAMETYALAIKDEAPDFAKELADWADRERWRDLGSDDKLKGEE